MAADGIEMTDDQVAKMTMDAIDGLMAKMPMMADRKCAFGFLLLTSYKLLRTAEGDEFVRGWLESALEEVKTCPPDVSLVAPH